MSDPFKEKDAETGKDAQVIFWKKEIELALKREEKWRKKAEGVIRIYEGEKESESSFNILYSNTETLLPACYNQLPKPICERRYQDVRDELAKASSKALERGLLYLADPGDDEYDSFDKLMEQAVLGALVPGRGATRFKYDPKFSGVSDAVGKGKKEENEGEDAGTEETGLVLPDTDERVEYETICGEDVEHDAFLLGYARRWADVPWVAYAHEMSKDMLKENFGSRIAGKIPVSPRTERDSKNWKKKDDIEGVDNRGSVETALVWEIWDRRARQVKFLADGYADKLVKVVDDPMGLSGFYNMPEPLQFLLKRSDLVPTPIYKLYEAQAKELNAVSMRIMRVVHAIKVRGFYDETLKELKGLLQAGDNVLIPLKQVKSIGERKLNDAIWMMPLQELVVVLQQLLLSRESTKQAIYEIMGIADIMRGSSRASETATAQNIKSQWGSLRIKRFQRYVQRYVRDCLRIMAELAGKHLEEKTWAAMTNLDYATAAETKEAKGAVQMIQSAALRAPPGPDGQPMLPPQVQQVIPQIQATLAKPSWGDILPLLKDNLLRSYKIDIETNSTLDASTQEDKQNVIDAMTAFGGILQGFGPMVETGAMPLGSLREMLLSVAIRFSFGRQLEDELKKIPDQKPQQGPDPKELEKAAEEIGKREQAVAKQEQGLAADAQKLESGKQQFQADVEMEKKVIANERKMLQMETQMAKMQLEMQKRGIVMEIEGEKQDLAMAGQTVSHQLSQQAMKDQQKNQQAAGKQQLTAQKLQQQKAAMKKPAGNGARK